MLDDNQGNGCSEEAVIFGTTKWEGRAWVWPSKRISVRRELGDCTRWNELNGTWWKIKEKKTCGHDFTLPKKKEHGGERTLDDFPGEATPWLSKGQCCLEEEKEWAVRDHFQRCLQFRLALIYLGVSIKYRICIILPYSACFDDVSYCTHHQRLPKKEVSETLAFSIKRC